MRLDPIAPLARAFPRGLHPWRREEQSCQGHSVPRSEPISSSRLRRLPSARPRPRIALTTNRNRVRRAPPVSIAGMACFLLPDERGVSTPRSPHDRLLRTASTLPTRRFVSNRIDLRVLGSAAGAFTIFGASPYEKREWRRGESNCSKAIKNSLQHARLPHIALISFRFAFRLIPSRSVQFRANPRPHGTLTAHSSAPWT